MRKYCILIVLLLCISFALAYAQKEMKKPEVDPKAEVHDAMKRGKMLFMDTKLGTVGMSCNSCHMEGGTKDGKMGEMKIKAFNNLARFYPKYFMMAKKVMTLDQVINWCIVNPMKGEALTWDSQKLADLAAYVVSVKAEKMEKKK